MQTKEEVPDPNVEHSRVPTRTAPVCYTRQNATSHAHIEQKRTEVLLLRGIASFAAAILAVFPMGSEHAIGMYGILV